MDPQSEDIDEPSQQLQATLHDSITRSLSSSNSTRRPLLTHLNADTTWLLSLPIPPSSATAQRSTSISTSRKRIYFHILIDPWLVGPQSDVAAFFSTQWHATPSSCQSIAEVEDVIRKIEGAASPSTRAATRPELKHQETGDVIVVDTDLAHRAEEEVGVEVEKGKAEEEEEWIDLVVISHEFTDHMHKPTLLTLSPRVPVLATAKAFSAISSWKHFTTVRKIERFAGDWRENGRGEKVLPPWMGVHRVAYAGNDLLYYHSAVMVSFASGAGEEAEAVLYTPHGISPSDLQPLTTAEPKIKVLALLHGLQDISLEGFWKKAQLNMGAHNGLKVVRMLGVKYWVGTHDEVKKGGGVVGWFLRRVGIGVEEALELEAVQEGKEEVNFVEVGNGESLVLE
ncbi:hypothetical protein L207DRAFT_513852 [Hyaloscypha variabilis F]|uniref:Metallo-beta-lactamase domain-containing protein n=1 Tax=Hyaloscypha variabilis (strain UAMH 11265 / GT02V1 / F) TaxID=1149755 RepID=A0A2J6RH88_HYAVF|nr:hypothetical protein L207DRAFT_513852 [Hyaloscypha variabilis F]